MKKKLFYIKAVLENSSTAIFISLLFIITFEYSFRLIRHAKTSLNRRRNEKSLSTELSKAFENKYSFSEIKKMSLKSKNILKYSPWIQVGNNDHKNIYSIVEEGKRKSYKNKLNCKNDSSIWFFGGSTMFGYGTPWLNSIPSEFIKYSESKGDCFKAINFGVPYHYSLQEVVYLSSELAKNNLKKPKFIIFLDGLNDFGQPGASIRKEPFFTPFINSIFEPSNDFYLSGPGPFSFNLQSINYIKNKFANSSKTNTLSTYRNRSLPSGYSTQKAALEISNNILNSSDFLLKICSGYKIECFQYLQPIASISYAPKGETFLSWTKNKELTEIYRIGYEYTSNKLNLLNSKYYKFFDLKDTFLNFNGLPYISGGHYSPKANNLLAKEIYEHIFKK